MRYYTNSGGGKACFIAFSLHPGGIRDTNMGSAVPLAELVALGFFNPDGTPVHEGTAKTISQGASTQVTAAFDPLLVEHTGTYLSDCIPHDDLLIDFAKDKGNATRLWELSEKLWGEPFVFRVA